ncbi:MAG: LD-carboxypeptidase [Oscillospiraceae bacterium]|nr:LD-carboxypeptidase [Oscillospiraceae bacterium]
MVFPRMPEAGGTVLLTAPSSPLSKDQPVEAIARAMEALGFRVRIGDSCRGSAPCGYAAAPPEVRAADINRGFADSSVDMIWCVRGGSTAWQLPPLLDYGCIAAHPKPFVGFSDVTTLHLAIWQQCGLVTFHGPTANRALAGEDFAWSWTSLRAALGMGERLEVQNPPGEEILPLRPGRARGELVGGNLSLVVQSLGTPWQIDAWGRVLFLEDVDEGVYALDRMLSQLRYAGVLDSAAGLAFGAFTQCRNAYREDYGPEALLREFFRDWEKPVVYNVRSAHCWPMAALPLGAMCTVDGDAGTFLFSKE